MSKSYAYPEFPYRQSAAQREGRVERHPLVVIGAGPIGLSVALDCAQRGIPVRLLDDNNTVSVGSRAVCYAKRPLEIWDRLGVADPLVAKGVRWQVGKVFLEDELVYQFDLLPESGHKMPAMINLQQYYVEQSLVDACEAHPLIDIGWKHKLVALQQQADQSRLSVQTPDGRFDLLADWVVACDGANSDTRKMVDAKFTGQFFEDRFLIADVVLEPGVLRRRRRMAGSGWVPSPNAGSGSTRLSTAARACCCTSSATMSGASISSSAATPTPRPRSGPSA